jgi:hypothetical protein
VSEPVNGAFVRPARYRPLLLDFRPKVLTTTPRGLLRAACEEGSSRLREARARTSDPDLGSHRSRDSTLVDMGPSGRQRTVGKLLAEGVQPETQAHSASVADGRQLVTHPVPDARVPHDPAESQRFPSPRASGDLAHGWRPVGKAFLRFRNPVPPGAPTSASESINRRFAGTLDPAHPGPGGWGRGGARQPVRG